MTRGGRKKPKTEKMLKPSPSKKAKGRPDTSDRDYVQWCFALFDKVHWHDSNYRDESFYEIAKHLKSYQGLTWGDIKQKEHPVKINRIITQARSRLGYLRQDDIEQLWRLELTGLQRMWGIRFNRTFRVLWWDPQHKICPSAKKHT